MKKEIAARNKFGTDVVFFSSECIEKGIKRVAIKAASLEPGTDNGFRGCLALWFRLVKNQDISTGPLARPFAHSLAPLTRLLAPDCLLCSRPPLHSLVRSLCSLPRLWDSE